MADQKITALTSLAQADITPGTDVLPIVDVGSPSVTKKATPKAVVGASVNDLAQTWNNVATTFTAIKMNVTDTASAAGSLLIDLQKDTVSQFSVTKAGSVNVAVNLLAGNVVSGAFLSGGGNFYLQGVSANYARFLDNALSGFSFVQGKLRTDADATTGLVPGALAATTNASIVLYDAAGQAYRVPCII